MKSYQKPSIQSQLHARWRWWGSLRDHGTHPWSGQASADHHRWSLWPRCHGYLQCGSHVPWCEEGVPRETTVDEVWHLTWGGDMFLENRLVATRPICGRKILIPVVTWIFERWCSQGKTSAIEIMLIIPCFIWLISSLVSVKHQPVGYAQLKLECVFLAVLW